MEQKPQYWKSLEEWAQDPQFVETAEKEFMSSPLQEEDAKDGWARREFLKLMGASLALSTTGCIRRPVQKIVPYVNQPEHLTMGVANYYSSSWSDANETYALLVSAREGRPTKLEGNPSAPGNSSALSARAQSHILSLYDPERLRQPKRNLLNEARTNRDTISTDWDYVDEKVVAQLKEGKVALLTGHLRSPSTRQLVADFAKAFNAKHAVYEAVNYDDLMQGQKESYGEAVIPRYRFDKAKRVVSIDADFLGTWVAPTAFARLWNNKRQPNMDMGRLISFDSTFSLTATNADIRKRIKPSQQLDVAMALLGALVGQSAYASDANLAAGLKAYGNAAERIGMTTEEMSKLAKDLMEHKGEAVVIAGGLTSQGPWAESLQVAVNLINEILGAEGTIIDGRVAPIRKTAGADMDIQGLIKSMQAGEVNTLIIHGTNPAYSLPNTAEFTEALLKVKMVIYTGDRVDETGALAHYILPDDHSLEKWGDNEIYDGVVAIQQPTIQPLGDTRSFEFDLINWAYLAEVSGPSRLLEPDDWYAYVRSYWKANLSAGNFESFWEEALKVGYVTAPGVNLETSTGRSFNRGALSVLRNVKPAAPNAFELALYTSVPLLDGSMANVSWLQELPDPVSKICWDNYAAVSIEAAKKMGLSEGDIIRVSVGDKALELPVHIQPGLHDEVVAIAVGYGRMRAGKVANEVGKNGYLLRAKGPKGFMAAGLGLELTKTGGHHELANVQIHHTMAGRPIINETTLLSFVEDKKTGIHKHKLWTMWPGHSYNGYRWGMSIDLNACTGCSACTVACQAENNIPVVGKKYVLQGREMHWLRVDRYFVGTNPNEPEVSYQPMMCQHCENAPCETVCPVLATVHSDEGLNEMVYNRCVGTRYCSNNCPYKVRRFNWFNYAKNIEKPLNMQLNPTVTVRTRGVMEKCTFCVQRINEAKQAARLEERKVRDGEIKTACQQSCPTEAIIFGDLNDPETKVAKAFKAEPRAYALLEEWSTAPSVRYLSKVRNNGKKLEGGHHGSHDAQEGGH